MAADKDKNKDMEDDELDTKRAPEGEDGGEGNDAQEEEIKKFGKKQILLFVVLPLVVLLTVGGGLYFAGFFGSDESVESEDEILVDKKSTGIFYDLPDIIVNLNTSGRNPRFLKISVSIELQKQIDGQAIEKALPRVLDHFQTYLRELREDDLRGSAGIYRLRLELLARINAAVTPVEVNDILFREILVQ